MSELLCEQYNPAITILAKRPLWSIVLKQFYEGKERCVACGVFTAKNFSNQYTKEHNCLDCYYLKSYNIRFCENCDRLIPYNIFQCDDCFLEGAVANFNPEKTTPLKLDTNELPMFDDEYPQYGI